MAEKGYDYFIVNPGELDEKHCEVCKTKCEVKRNVMGPTSFATAIAHKHTLHDAFICPNSEKIWHQAALELLKAIEKTPSKRLADLMRLDLEDILKDRDI